MGSSEPLGSEIDQVLAFVEETQVPAGEGGDVQQGGDTQEGGDDGRGMLCSLEGDETVSKQSLSCHRKSGVEVSQQSIESHLQRPRLGGQAPPEERKGCQLNGEPEREGSRWGTRGWIPRGLVH